MIAGLVAFLRDLIGRSDLGVAPETRWLRAVAHVLLGVVAGVAVSVAPPLAPWLLALWAASQAVQSARDGWSRRSLRDALEDTAWTAAGLWLGAITEPREPVVYGWSVAALGAALLIRGALLYARRP